MMSKRTPLNIRRVGHVVYAHWGDWSASYDIPRPDDSSLAWRCRYDSEGLSRSDFLAIAGLLEQLRHLHSHPAGTERIIDQLRSIRRGWSRAVEMASGETQPNGPARGTNRNFVCNEFARCPTCGDEIEMTRWWGDSTAPVHCDCGEQFTVKIEASFRFTSPPTNEPGDDR